MLAQGKALSGFSKYYSQKSDLLPDVQQVNNYTLERHWLFLSELCKPGYSANQAHQLSKLSIVNTF